MNGIHKGRSGNALAVKGRKTERPVVRSKLHKHQKEEIGDRARREEGATVRMDAAKVAFRVPSKTVTARSADAVWRPHLGQHPSGNVNGFSFFESL